MSRLTFHSAHSSRSLASTLLVTVGCSGSTPTTVCRLLSCRCLPCPPLTLHSARAAAGYIEGTALRRAIDGAVGVASAAVQEQRSAAAQRTCAAWRALRARLCVEPL